MSNQTKYDAIIIGAGIGGLTCGNILAKNGLRVLILEKNPFPGGAVSTFYKNGYPVDITHSICGLNKGSFINKLFDYLDLTENLDSRKLAKAFIHISANDNKHFYSFTDIEKYQNDLCNYYPHERKGIQKLFQVMSIIWDKEILRSYYNPNIAILSTYPFVFPNLAKYQHYTFEQFLSKFVKDPALIDVISVGWPYIGLEQSKVSALYMICIIMAYHKEGSYFIKGGFGKIPRILEHNFIRLGGNIIYDTEVTNIIFSNKKIAQGVKISTGNSYSAVNVISNADTIKTFNDLIGNKNLSFRLRNKIQKNRLSCSAVQIHLVVKAQIPAEYLDTGSIIMKSQITILNQSKNCTLVISIHKTSDFLLSETKDLYIINILCLPVDYPSWEDCQNLNNDVYETAKKTVALQTYDNFKKLFSFEQLISYNVLTPLSFSKWLHATGGAVYDIETSPDQMLLQRFNNLKPIKNLFCVGAKSFPGPGIAGALCSSVSVADMILKGQLTRGKFVLNNYGRKFN